jgi:hypothetical protein
LLKIEVFPNQIVLTEECRVRLKDWVEQNNEFRLQINEIQRKCADFEQQLVLRIKEAGKAYSEIAENEFRVATDLFGDLKRIFS